MHIAIATCKTLHESERDDDHLREALRRRHATFETLAWDAPDVDWSRFDACLPRSTWDYMERLDEFLAWCESLSGQCALFNPVSTLRWNTQKTYLRELREAGLRIAPTEFVPAGGAVDVAHLLEQSGWHKAFIKPWIGAGARETLPFTADDVVAAQSHVDRLLLTEGLMVQPYLESVNFEGEYSVVFIDGTRTHVVRKVPRPGDYRVMDDFGASDGPAELAPEDLAFAERARQACESILGLAAPLLYARIDFLRDAAGDLVLNEAELVEPSLFFRHAPHAADALAAAILRRVG